MISEASLALLLIAAPMAGCGAATVAPATPAIEGQQMDGAQEKAIEAGKRYVKEKFPDFVEDRKTAVVTDAGDNWEFTYRLPADVLGGAPFVLLSKADLLVVKAYRTQ